MFPYAIASTTCGLLTWWPGVKNLSAVAPHLEKQTPWRCHFFLWKNLFYRPTRWFLDCLERGELVHFIQAWNTLYTLVIPGLEAWFVNVSSAARDASIFRWWCNIGWCSKRHTRQPRFIKLLSEDSFTYINDSGIAWFLRTNGDCSFAVISLNTKAIHYR